MNISQTTATKSNAVHARPPIGLGDLAYQGGFANEHATEAIPGALPELGNSPQRHSMGLYTEQINGTPFTVPRSENRRSWLYRIFPSAAAQGPWTRHQHDGIDEVSDRMHVSPSRLRWFPISSTSANFDFIDGLSRIAQSGGASQSRGISVFAYTATRSMGDRAFSNMDGELLVIPQVGTIRFVTELGQLEAKPGQIVLLPRGIRFKVQLCDSWATGFVCENFGAPFTLPSLGPIGSNGLANARDFLAPVAWFENSARSSELLSKFGGAVWRSDLSRSPFDVVAWRGTYAPYLYDMRRFNSINSVTFDHTDPSIYTALTSASGFTGVANADFCILPPRWIVSNDTFRPPWFHRNIMSEFVISLQGTPESRGDSYKEGACYIHNSFCAHGPDPEVVSRASQQVLAPMYEDTLMVMFESNLPFGMSKSALLSANRDGEYESNWKNMQVNFNPGT